MKLTWPESLGDVTLQNMNTTELWFLVEHLKQHKYINKNYGDIVRAAKFGYEEGIIDVGEHRYLIKFKSTIVGTYGWRDDDDIHENQVFFVQKFKKKVEA